jgi:hypothetical protein
MKRFVPHLIAAVFALASGAAWAQQQDDLDVTMRVLPANASAGSAVSEMKLPDAASDRARAASAFGQSTATQAHDMKGDLGRDFGQSVSEAARAQGVLGASKGKGKGKAP